MMMANLFDNPIFVKHLRSRLRPPQILPFIVIVVILCFCICWIAVGPRDADPYQREESFHLGYTLLLILQGLILFLLGSAQVAGSISQARESGMMDFHRISPLRPSTLTAGFLFGAPIREYLLFACTLPFLAIFMVFGSLYVSIAGMLAVLIIMLVSGVLYHLISLLIGLVAPKPRGTNVLALLLILILHALFAFPFAGFMTSLSTAISLLGTEPYRGVFGPVFFFGSQLPIALVTLLHLLVLIFFLLLAATRKMRNERAFSYSKPMAVLFFAAIAVLIIGDLFPVDTGEFDWGLDNINPVLAIYLLSLIGSIFCLGITPRIGDFLKGIRHAKNIGLKRLSFWHDYSANWWPMFFISLLIIVAGNIFFLRYHERPELLTLFRNIGFIKGSFIGACVVLFFGAAKQAFDILFRKNSLSYFALLLFGVWIIPMLIGIVLMIISNGNSYDYDNIGYTQIMSISPLFGIATAVIDKPNDYFPHATAVIPMVVTPLLALGAIVLSSIALKRAAKSAELLEVTVKVPAGTSL